jgi:hypothetical protein
VAPGFRPTIEQALDFYVPEDRPVLKDAFIACVEQGAPFDLELRVVTARGRLATVQRIIARHDGCLWADATVGGGASFSFTLGEPGMP